MTKIQRTALLRTSVLAGFAAAGAAAAPALAQEPQQTEPAPQASQEVIQVTGTRIQRANLVSASPVTQVDAQDFALSGTTRVEDLLNTLPQIAPSFDSFTVNPSTGTAVADLRGLGSNRTLVLVNGQRLQPGGIRTQAPDLNQIPSAMISRVEVLTGGASAVYGSDAMAGVVNFILDREFEGISVTAGASGYQHNNRNSYLQGLMDDAGFDYPSGNSGIDGRTYNFDVAIGSGFADGRGHASAYFTYRKNEELLQGARDYSSCALNLGGTACGGSDTAPDPTFAIFQFDAAGEPTFGLDAILQGDGSWTPGFNLYNFAPVNHYMRPDERYTFGSFISYEVSPLFRPFLDFGFANTNTNAQIAESGTFFADQIDFECSDPLLGSLCADLASEGLDPGEDVSLFIGKRNVEGGPRISEIDSTSYRASLGSEGDFGNGWAYNASFTYAANTSSEISRNDFLRDQVVSSILACGDPELADTPACYNVLQPGGVTEEAANELGGVGIESGRTEIIVASAYVTGDLGFVAPAASDPVSVVAGTEWRRESYSISRDSNTQTGNFTGVGGPAPEIAGEYDVTEFYGEAIIPLVQDRQFIRELGLELGYRYSNYNTSGGVSTYKIAGSWMPIDEVRFRGGYNRAIRAPNVGELFTTPSGALWGGSDPCAGADPEFTAEQCANTGVTAAQYGNVSANNANQYNQITGGNTQLQPEQADTWTFGAVFTPINNLNISVDYYDIRIEDQIGAIGASTILRNCALSGEDFLCDRINRGPGGNLWIGSAGDPGVGFIENTSDNFGDLVWRGIDFEASYGFSALGGNVTASFNGSYALEQEINPLPGVSDTATYDCAGVINPACQTPNWRHTARVSYDMGSWWTGSLRWRHIGALDYTNQDGTPATTDQLLVDRGNELGSFNYLDISGSFDVTEATSLTLGINNVLDREPPMVGSSLALNANAPGGYDQLGRFLFASVNVRY